MSIYIVPVKKFMPGFEPLVIGYRLKLPNIPAVFVNSKETAMRVLESIPFDLVKMPGEQRLRYAMPEIADELFEESSEAFAEAA